MTLDQQRAAIREAHEALATAPEDTDPATIAGLTAELQRLQAEYPEAYAAEFTNPPE